jgi:hypothetical protein
MPTAAGPRCFFRAMSTKSRQKIYSGPILAAKIRVHETCRAAQGAIREADRPDAAWKAMALSNHCPVASNGGLSLLEVDCNWCKSRASLPLGAIRRRRGAMKRF